MSLNSVERSYIEKSRVLCLALLPLVMVSPAELKTQLEQGKEGKLTFKDDVQAKIADSHEHLRELINPDNKLFYRFIKETFKAEDEYNMCNHFERYFSMSGFLRDLLNEIIKL